MPIRCVTFSTCWNGLLQKQVRLPADALGAGAEFLERPVLNLADTLLADSEQVADLPQAVRAVAGQAEAGVEHLAFARTRSITAIAASCCCHRSSG